MMGAHIEIDYSNEYLKSYEEFIHLPNMHYVGTLPIEKETIISMSWSLTMFLFVIRGQRRIF